MRMKWVPGWLALAATLVSGLSLAGEAANGTACEPADRLNIGVQLHSVTDLGTTARVVVELKVYSEPSAVGEVTVSGRARSAGLEYPIPTVTASVPGSRPGKIRLTYELDQGLDHLLVFDVRAERDPSLRSSASLRVNLDPAREPERLDGVVQYRALMSGEEQ